MVIFLDCIKQHIFHSLVLNICYLISQLPSHILPKIIFLMVTMLYNLYHKDALTFFYFFILNKIFRLGLIYMFYFFLYYIFYFFHAEHPELPSVNEHNNHADLSNTPANTNENIALNLTRIFNAGPEVSFNGSPTVSPITAALCSSLPFFF